MNKNNIKKLAAAFAAATTLITTGTAVAGHDYHNGIDYARLDRESSRVQSAASELTCAFEREMRHRRAHCNTSNDRRILDWLKELERRVGHVHKAVHTHCSLPTIQRRARYAHEVADSTAVKIRHAGGLSRRLESAFNCLHSDIVALEELVEHADHHHARVDHRDYDRHSDYDRNHAHGRDHRDYNDHRTHDRSARHHREFDGRRGSSYGHREASISPRVRASIPLGRSGIVLRFAKD